MNLLENRKVFFTAAAISKAVVTRPHLSRTSRFRLLMSVYVRQSLNWMGFMVDTTYSGKVSSTKFLYLQWWATICEVSLACLYLTLGKETIQLMFSKEVENVTNSETIVVLQVSRVTSEFLSRWKVIRLVSHWKK